MFLFLVVFPPSKDNWSFYSFSLSMFLCVCVCVERKNQIFNPLKRSARLKNCSRPHECATHSHPPTCLFEVMPGQSWLSLKTAFVEHNVRANMGDESEVKQKEQHQSVCVPVVLVCATLLLLHDDAGNGSGNPAWTPVFPEPFRSADGDRLTYFLSFSFPRSHSHSLSLSRAVC